MLEGMFISEAEARDNEEKRTAVYQAIAHLAQWEKLKNLELKLEDIGAWTGLSTEVVCYVLQDLKREGFIDFKLISYDELIIRLLELKTRNVWCAYSDPTPEQGKFFFFLKKLNPELFWRLYDKQKSEYDIENLAKDLMLWALENNCNLYEPQGIPAFYFALGVFKGRYCKKYGIKVFFSGYKWATPVEVAKDEECMSTPPSIQLKHTKWFEL